jgi:hypothetical protein
MHRVREFVRLTKSRFLPALTVQISVARTGKIPDQDAA